MVSIVHYDILLFPRSFCSSLLVIVIEEKTCSLFVFLFLDTLLTLSHWAVELTFFQFHVFSVTTRLRPSLTLDTLLRIPLRMKVLYNIYCKWFLLYIFITLLDGYYNQVLYCGMDWSREKFTCDIHDESDYMIVLPYFTEAKRGTLEHISFYFHLSRRRRRNIIMIAWIVMEYWFTYQDWEK